MAGLLSRSDLAILPSRQGRRGHVRRRGRCRYGDSAFRSAVSEIGFGPGVAFFALNILVQQIPPNDGTLVTIGPLGITALGPNTMGFDIGSVSGTAYLQTAETSGTQDNLYTVDLGTGAATLVGAIGPSTLNTFGISAQAVPEPGTYALLGMGLLGGAWLLRGRRATRA